MNRLKVEIPELFDEQHLLGHLKDFYNDSKTCRLTATSLLVDGYNKLYSEKDVCFIYTDGNFVLALNAVEDRDSETLHVYLLNIDGDNLSLQLYKAINIDFFINTPLDIDLIKIVENLIYMYPNESDYCVKVINIKTEEIIQIDSSLIVDKLEVWDNKLVLINTEQIKIHESGKEPYLFQIRGHECIKYLAGKFYIYSTQYKREIEQILNIREINIYTGETIKSWKFDIEFEGSVTDVLIIDDKTIYFSGDGYRLFKIVNNKMVSQDVHLDGYTNGSIYIDKSHNKILFNKFQCDIKSGECINMHTLKTFCYL
jgi:hypothetical protein